MDWFFKSISPLIGKYMETIIPQIEDEEILKEKHSNLIYVESRYLYISLLDAPSPFPFKIILLLVHHIP